MTDIKLPVLGIDMLSDELRFPAGAVRSAVNVDIDTSGQFKRRDGYTVVASGTGFTGLRCFAPLTFIGRGTVLHTLDVISYQMTPVCDMGSDDPMDFSEYNQSLYVCAPHALWRFARGSSIARPVGVALPASLPTVLAHPAGTLTPGTYGVALSIVDALGEESPTVMLGTVALTAGLRLTGLALVDEHRYRLYLTPPDGDVLYLAEEFDAVLTEYVVSAYPNGAQCQTLHLSPMPAGDFVRGHAGRLYVAAGDTLWFSEPLRPHLTDRAHNFVRFVGRIRFVELVEGGAYVGDDRGVWWLAGADPSQWAMALALSTLAIRRSSVLVSAEHLPSIQATGNCAVWLSEQGYVVGMSGGTARPLHADRIRIAPGIEGRSVFITRDGTKQVITLSASIPAAPVGVAIDTSTPEGVQYASPHSC